MTYIKELSTLSFFPFFPVLGKKRNKKENHDKAQ